jgi:quercetin dioxygenase-like cupin family protein
MKTTLLFLAALAMSLAPGTRAAAQVGQNRQTIVSVTPEQVRWFTPPYYTDGRQRAKLFGDSDRDVVWVDRVKIPGGKHVPAHTHPRDELATVIRGTWYVGVGEPFDQAKLKAYPAGSFVMIPAGVPHFVATKKGPVVVQLNGTGKWDTHYIEK